MSGDTGEDVSAEEAPARRGLPVMALLPLVVFSLLAVLFLFQLVSGKDTSEVPSALIDKPAPEKSAGQDPTLRDMNRKHCEAEPSEGIRRDVRYRLY